MRTGIGAQNVGQQHRVGGIGLRPRHLMAGPVTRGCQRVDRVDRPSGHSQRRHPQSAIGFDRHWDRMLRGVAGFGQHAQEVDEAGGVVADASARHYTSIGVDDGDVVMFCGPIYSAI